MKVVDLIYVWQSFSLFRKELECQYLECEFRCGQQLYYNYLESKKRQHSTKQISETRTLICLAQPLKLQLKIKQHPLNSLIAKNAKHDSENKSKIVFSTI